MTCGLYAVEMYKSKGKCRMNKVRVNICGLNYNLSTDNDTEFVLEISRKLDREIKAVLKRFPAMDTRWAAILCALEAYEERKKSEDSLDNLRSQLKEYMDESGKLRDARDKAVMEADRLREKLEAQGIQEPDTTEYEEDAEQLVLENTVTPAVTIPVPEEKARDAAPPKQNRSQRRSKKK